MGHMTRRSHNDVAELTYSWSLLHVVQPGMRINLCSKLSQLWVDSKAPSTFKL